MAEISAVAGVFKFASARGGLERIQIAKISLQPVRPMLGTRVIVRANGLAESLELFGRFFEKYPHHVEEKLRVSAKPFQGEIWIPGGRSCRGGHV